MTRDVQRGAWWAGNGQDWRLEPGNVAEYRCPPDWKVLPRVLSDYTIWYVRGGQAELRCEGQTFALTAGDLLIVPPNVEHEASHDPARPLWTITAHFVIKDANGATLPPEGAALPGLHRRLIEPRVFDQYLDRLVELHALRPPGWQQIMTSLFVVLLAELRREDAQATDLPLYGRSTYAIIAQSLARLEAEGHYFVRPSALAAACGFSVGHFSRLFRRQFGQTPQQYVLRRRIERARHLLLESDLSVQQVALSLGYQNVSFFTRQFKALVGQPPAGFRRAARDVT